MTARALVAAGALSAVLTSCGSPGGDSGPAARTITVFAAASLTGTFTEIAQQLEEEEPGTSVVLNLGASSALAQQILDGAPADVFAAANAATMSTVVDAGAVVEPQVFAGNTLQIAVPAGGPDLTLADFADPDRTLALCAPQVPCGAAAQEVFATAGITPRPDTLEQDVKAALSKVRLGEVDAALVYRTDVLAAGDEVRGLDVPGAAVALNEYLVARLRRSDNPAGATAFVDRVLSEEGQRVLVDAGFDRR